MRKAEALRRNGRVEGGESSVVGAAASNDNGGTAVVCLFCSVIPKLETLIGHKY